MIAAGAAAVLLVLAGAYLDTPWKAQGAKEWALTADRHGTAGALISLGFVALGLGVVFGVVVIRGLGSAEHAALRRSLALAVAGALSLAVFWTGLPVILAAGATVLSLDARTRLGRTPATAVITLLLAAATTAAATNLALAG
ncbi:MAG TPA: hypothetical protein VI357_24470 [Mycobacteriales bacterium]